MFIFIGSLNELNKSCFISSFIIIFLLLMFICWIKAQNKALTQENPAGGFSMLHLYQLFAYNYCKDTEPLYLAELWHKYIHHYFMYSIVSVPSSIYPLLAIHSLLVTSVINYLPRCSYHSLYKDCKLLCVTCKKCII